MACLVFCNNPLSLKERTLVELEPGATPYDWLQEHYPNGCGWPLRWWLNGIEQKKADGTPDLADLDMELEADDHVVLLAAPAIPAAAIGTIIVTALITAVVSAAISLAISFIFMKKPSTPGFAQSEGPGTPNAVYSLRGQQNLPRIGEPIPVAYGTVIMAPDYAMQPHRWFVQPNDEYVDSLLVLSQGEVLVHQVLLGDTPVEALAAGIISYAVVPPWQHQQQYGRLGFHSNFYENVVTCPEVSGQEFRNPGESAGFFRLSKTGLTGRYITFDLEWPQGMYQQVSWGTTGTQVGWDMNVWETDSFGNLIGTYQTFPFINSMFYGNNPLRLTWAIDMGRSAMWAVQLVRHTAAEPNPNTVNAFKWTGLKLLCDMPAPGPIYGDVTLLAVRVKASQGLGEGQQQIRVKMTRRLPLLGSYPMSDTVNPADALVDIYTNTVYGARRPRDECDITKLTALRNLWTGYGFNAVYTNSVTVWQAMQQAVQGMAAAPLPIGSFLTVAQDGVKPARSMLFSMQNIARESFQLSYEWDKVGDPDGIEIEYRDPLTFSPAYARVPGGSVNPEKVNLFGCTNATHAFQYATLLWNRRHSQRKTIEFGTELEGLIPYPGERVAVSHMLPDWGFSGFVAEANGTTITLDRELPYAETPQPWYMMFRSNKGRATNAVPIIPASANQVILYEWPIDADGEYLTFHFGEAEENTHFVFGTGATMVRDFILTEIRHKGGTSVTLAGVLYNPNVYVGAMPFLMGPVP